MTMQTNRHRLVVISIKTKCSKNNKKESSMKNTKLLLAIVAFSFNAISFSAENAPVVSSNAGKTLADIIISSAGVLPYFTHDGVKYVLLGEEEKDRTYGDYSGKMEKGIDKDGLDIAAREFSEESWLGQIKNMSIMQVRDYISANATKILAYAFSAPHLRGQFDATFITNIQDCYMDITNNFYVEREKELQKPLDQQRKDYLGKRTVAWCNYDDFAQAIKKSEFKKPAFVEALVFDKEGNKTKQQVELRPYLISKVSVYYKHPEYCEQGADPRLLFLDWAQVPKK